MALHEMTLARLAGCGPDHLFMRKYRLFESGRWPLGVLRGAFHLSLSERWKKPWLTPS
jgi:hypothetical protein